MKPLDFQAFVTKLLYVGFAADVVQKNGQKTWMQLGKQMRQNKKNSYSLVQCILDKDVAEDKVLLALSQSNGLPLLDKGIVAEPAAVNSISSSLAANYCVMPVRVEQNRLVLAVRNPYDVQMLEQVKAACNMEVDCVLATKDVIMAAIDCYYPNRASTSKLEGLDTIKPLF